MNKLDRMDVAMIMNVLAGAGVLVHDKVLKTPNIPLLVGLFGLAAGSVTLTIEDMVLTVAKES